VTSQAAFGPPFFPVDTAESVKGDAPFCSRRARRWTGGFARSLNERNRKIRSLATHPSIVARGRKAGVAIAAAIAVVTNGGCATEKAYEGPALPKSERAIVHADPALSAGLPVSLRLRQVDQREVPLTANSVELPPGRHVLLVDCRVSESGATNRFTLAVELEPGGDYRLVATASARNCEAVTLQPR